MLLHDFFDIKKPKVKEDSWHGGGNEPKDAWHSEAGVVEGRVDSPVSSAITRRILNQRHDLLKFGPQAVMDAVDQVAEWVGEVEEIGSSDVSAWVAQVARYLQTQDGQGVAEGLPGEFIGGTAGGVGGAVVGATVGGPIGAVVGGAAGGTAGQIAGRELTDEQKLNEFGPLLVAGARLFMAAAPKIAQVFGKVGQAGARGVGQAAKAGAGIAAKNAGQIGVGVGAYEIGSSVADIVKDITAKVGAAVDEKTIFDLATLAFKYAIPAGIVLAILYGGKKAIDSLFADHKTPQGVAESKADYKIKSIGTDAKGDYYISPSTGKKVYKSGVKVGDHENPKTGEHMKVEGYFSDQDVQKKDKQYAGTKAYHAKKKAEKEKTATDAKTAFDAKFGGSNPVGTLKIREQGVAEGFPHDVDHMPGQTNPHANSNCSTCHGRKFLYKMPDGQTFADNRVGAKRIKCTACNGTGDKQGMKEGGMPSSVIKSKQRYGDMSDKDFAELHQSKADNDLVAMAWRHGYGKGSLHYVNKRKRGKEGMAEGMFTKGPAIDPIIGKQINDIINRLWIRAKQTKDEYLRETVQELFNILKNTGGTYSAPGSPGIRDVAEAKNLKKHVKIVKGPDAGKTGWIREVKHGAFEGAPKTYYIDLDDGGQANNLPATALRLVKEHGVTESLDQPYTLQWYSPPSRDSDEVSYVDAFATLDDNSELEISFTKKGDEVFHSDDRNNWLLEFSRGDSQEVTGGGDEKRIFATVLVAIQEFVKKYNPNSVTFSASKDPKSPQLDSPAGTKVNPGSRAKLYNRMVQRYASAAGYIAQQREGNDKIVYVLRRAKPDVAEGANYWNKLQDTRSKKINSLVDELEQSIK